MYIAWLIAFREVNVSRALFHLLAAVIFLNPVLLLHLPPTHASLKMLPIPHLQLLISHTHSTLCYIGWITGLYLASLMLYKKKKMYDTFFMVSWFHSPKLWQIAWHSTYSKLQIWWSTNIKCGLLLPESRQCPLAKFAAVTPTCCSTSGRDSEDGLWTRNLWAEDTL